MSNTSTKSLTPVERELIKNIYEFKRIISEKELGYIDVDINISGRADGDLKYTAKVCVSNSSYESENRATANSLNASFEESLRRCGFQLEHKPLLLPNLMSSSDLADVDLAEVEEQVVANNLEAASAELDPFGNEPGDEDYLEDFGGGCDLRENDADTDYDDRIHTLPSEQLGDEDDEQIREVNEKINSTNTGE